MRWEKGLCFNCDEKFTPGHKCSSKLFLLVSNEDEASLEPSLATLNPDPPEPIEDLSPTQISLHALSGHIALETLQVVGLISNQGVRILIDGGNTHNFLQHRLVLALGLHTKYTNPLCVTVENGDALECHQLCNDLIVQILGHSFPVDFHVLSLCSADVVLGVQWLKSLGLIVTNYNTLTMKFIHGDKMVELKSERASGLELISPPQLRHMV